MNPEDAATGARLQAARRQMGLTQGQVGSQMGMAISTVSAIEAGKRAVTGRELRSFARLYHRPLSYFFDEGSQESPGFQYLFRSAALDLLDRESIIQLDQLIRDYAELERIVQAAELPSPPDYSQFPFRTDQDAESLADMERVRLGLGEVPLKDLMDLLDSTVGVRTFLVPVEKQSWSGLAVRGQDGRPCIGVNAKEESYRRNFDLAHEYCHVLVHMTKQSAPAARIDKEIDPAGNSADERFANAFASAFLMPRRAVLSQLERVLGANAGHFTDYDLVHLAMHFGVSGKAMSLRLVSLRRLPRHVHEEYWRRQTFKDLARALGYSVEDWSLKVVLPARYRYLAFKAFEEGRISLAKLAELLHENYYELRNRLQDAQTGQLRTEAAG